MHCTLGDCPGQPERSQIYQSVCLLNIFILLFLNYQIDFYINLLFLLDIGLNGHIFNAFTQVNLEFHDLLFTEPN